ncbi:hypothetical protein F4811DRAFT_104946 [Daldinia bambusicola]|nr:hypothetical protein F4811DRAFT_104946 [Daldinia bambusicola]
MASGGFIGTVAVRAHGSIREALLSFPPCAAAMLSVLQPRVAKGGGRVQTESGRRRLDTIFFSLSFFQRKVIAIASRCLFFFFFFASFFTTIFSFFLSCLLHYSRMHACGRDSLFPDTMKYGMRLGRFGLAWLEQLTSRIDETDKGANHMMKRYLRIER